jgi:hypothetical protein
MQAQAYEGYFENGIFSREGKWFTFLKKCGFMLRFGTNLFKKVMKKRML